MTTNQKLQSVLDVINPNLFRHLTELPNKCFTKRRLQKDMEFLEQIRKRMKDFDEFGVVAYYMTLVFQQLPELMNRTVVELLRITTDCVDKPISDNQLYTNLSYSWRELDDYRKMRKMWIESDDYYLDNEPPKPQLIDQFMVMKTAGIGLTWDEGVSLAVTIKSLSTTITHLSSIRFWGKIFGRCYDYYILECDLTPEETDLRNASRVKVSQSTLVTQEERFRWSMNPSISVCNKDAEYSLWRGNSGVLKNEKQYQRHELDERILELNEGRTLFPDLIFPELPVMTIVNETSIPEEPIGEGTNAKLYLVSNDPTMGEWTELPPLQPDQISCSRKIKHHFIGDLHAPVNSFPMFPGEEMHYLGCQVVRITASTHISPTDYYESPWGEEGDVNEEEPQPREDEDEELKLNTEYTPIPPGQLGDAVRGLHLWVHHRPYILPQGRVTYWSSTKSKPPIEQEMEGENEFIEEYNPEMVGPRLLTKIDKDRTMYGSRAWSVNIETAGFHNRSAVLARSQIWPGAVAWAKDTMADNVYVGWGQKKDSSMIGHEETNLTESCSAEYEVGPDVIEYDDPAVEVTTKWIDKRTEPAIQEIDLNDNEEDDEEEEEEEEIEFDNKSPEDDDDNDGL